MNLLKGQILTRDEGSVVETVGYEWCIAPLGDLRGYVAVTSTAGWLVLVRHVKDHTKGEYRSEYVLPDQLRQKP